MSEWNFISCHFTTGKFGRLKNQVRKRLAEELREIDGVVKNILKK
jgi:hypothetical protein